jgi:hypothetical protein
MTPPERAARWRSFPFFFVYFLGMSAAAAIPPGISLILW